MWHFQVISIEAGIISLPKPNLSDKGANLLQCLLNLSFYLNGWKATSAGILSTLKFKSFRTKEQFTKSGFKSFSRTKEWKLSERYSFFEFTCSRLLNLSFSLKDFGSRFGENCASAARISTHLVVSERNELRLLCLRLSLKSYSSSS